MFEPRFNPSRIMKRFRLLIPALACLFWVCSLPLAASADSKLDEAKISEALHPGFHHLLALIGSTSLDAQTLNNADITAVLEFVASEKPENTLHFVDESFGLTSAYHEFVIEKELDHVLRISFNPDIPSYITTPSSTRLSHWNGNTSSAPAFPNFAEPLNSLKEPVMAAGVETVENTPDLFTGGYYKYDLERTLLLFNYKGRRVLLSLSKQKDTSEVGKKGVVLGSDDDWSYLYSGIKGLNKGGLGWVSSYMYDSYSIIVYLEQEPGQSPVKCGAFKWLRAGWKSINMVKKEHIYRGLHRFASTYKAIVENPSLPEAGKIAEIYQRISALDLTALKQLNRTYLQSLKQRHAQDEALSAKWVAAMFEDDRYVDQMNRDELESVLVLEYLKRALGKPYEIDVEKRLASLTARPFRNTAAPRCSPVPSPPAFLARTAVPRSE